MKNMSYCRIFICRNRRLRPTGVYHNHAKFTQKHIFRIGRIRSIRQ